MSPLDTLRQQWAKILVFRVGSNADLSTEQLPQLSACPQDLLDDLSPDEATALGYVLSLALLKLSRPDNGPDLQEGMFSVEGRVDAGLFFWYLPEFWKTSAATAAIWDSVLWNLGSYLTLATRSPEYLAQFHRLLDSLGNNSLHQMAMQAVTGQEIADLYTAILYGGVTLPCR